MHLLAEESDQLVSKKPADMIKRIYQLNYLYIISSPEHKVHAQIQRGGQGIRTPPSLKNHKNIGFLSKTGPDPLKNHKATKPAFNVGLSSARQRNAIKMTFRWRVNYGPLILSPMKKNLN